MSCTYSEAKKNIPNMPEATSSITVLAVESVRTRKMLRRTSGALERALDHDERGEQCDAGAEHAERPGRAPAPGLRLDDPEHERDQAGRDRGGAGQVERAVAEVGA